MGRQTEVAALVSAIEHLNEGRGGVVKVIGENGIGKSRLVDQALPALSDVHHINIRSEPYGAATPYRPLRDPLRHLLGVERSSHVQMAEQLESTVKDLDPTLLPMVPLIADVAMVEVDSTPEVDAIEPKFRQDRTADVLVYLFERALAGPILFEAEDGHWMDDASVHVLNRIASVTGEQPWLVLTTRRDEPGGFNPEGTEMRLGPLSEEESRNLVIKAMEAAPLRPHDLDAIVARAGGLPLFLEEIIRAVRRAGAVDALPDSLDAVVAAQIDALPPLPRRLLGYASVLGRSFRIATLNGLIADEQVELDSATRGQLAGFLDLEGTTRLRFRHALFRDVAYEGLSFRRRKELHQRAGELAERAASDDVESVADVLALHFSLAGDAERTWRYARIAGDQARDAYANVEAAVQYERALDGVRRLPSVDREAEAGVWERLGDVRERAGLYEDSVEGFGKAIRLSGNDVHQRAYLLFRRARARLWIGDYQMALRDTSKGLKAVGTVKDAEAGRARAMLSGFRAAIRQFQARPQEALDSALTAVKEAQNVSDDETLARGYLVLDWAYRVLGQPDRAVHLPKALEIYERMDYLPGVAETTMNLGAAAYMDGRWDDAVAWYTRSHDASLESGNQVRAAVAGANMAELLIDQGHLDEADLRLGQAIRVLRASNNAGDSIFAELQAGRLMVERGRCDAAATILERIKSEAASIGEAFSVLEASLELARSRLLAGDAPDGLAILNDARDAAGGVPSHFAARFAYVEALIRIELGEFDEASRILESAIVEADRQGLLFEVALLRTTRADLARRAGVQPDPTDISEAGEIFAQLGVDRSA
jgi:tetratricopeptide (TPR) repeat protein